MSLKAIAVAGLSALALAASGCSGDSDPEADATTVPGFSNLTTTFVSPTHGFSFRYGRGRPIPATKIWDPVIEPPVDTRGTYDGPFDIWETGYAAFFKSASTEIPEGVSIDEWVDEYVTPLAAGGWRLAVCLAASRQRSPSMGNRAGSRSATTPRRPSSPAGGSTSSSARASQAVTKAWFDAWIATIDLRPEDAAAPSSTPSS